MKNCYYKICISYTSKYSAMPHLILTQILLSFVILIFVETISIYHLFTDKINDLLKKLMKDFAFFVNISQNNTCFLVQNI